MLSLLSICLCFFSLLFVFLLDKVRSHYLQYFTALLDFVSSSKISSCFLLHHVLYLCLVLLTLDFFLLKFFVVTLVVLYPFCFLSVCLKFNPICQTFHKFTTASMITTTVITSSTGTAQPPQLLRLKSNQISNKIHF